MTPTQRPIIMLDNVSKTYHPDHADRGKYVISNVTLTIHSGEFVIIFGPSGSGKSTLLYLIAGLEQPTSGTVEIHKRNLSHFDADELATYHRKKMGIVFQNFNLIKSLNVWENVALPQTAGGETYHLRKYRANHLLRMLGLGEYANRHTNDLSGGEQQRVAIARALINRPSFLLIDEPTGNLDSQSADAVMQIFRDIHHSTKRTIVLITHNPQYLAYATRAIHLQDGTIVKEESMQPSEHVDQPYRSLREAV